MSDGARLLAQPHGVDPVALTLTGSFGVCDAALRN